jgi:16S rRNA (uracil1498-N3)-methyltransferase
MPARRFFVHDAHRVGELVAIDGSDAHKIQHVLRLRDGDEIEVVDSSAQLFAATLEIALSSVGARLQALREGAAVDSVAIDVAQGVPKGSKMDFVVEKLSELGVRTVLPVMTERTIVHEVGSSKLERWRRLARAAAAQSGRRDLLEVADPLPFERLCERMAGYDAVLFLWEVAAPERLRERLAEVRGAGQVLIVVGPEGGFSHAEAEAAQAAGARLLSLGSRILRTETAGLVAVAIVSYELG